MRKIFASVVFWVTMSTISYATEKYSLSRTVPLIESMQTLKIVCNNAEKNSQIRPLGNGKFLVLSGRCRGKSGYVSAENIQIVRNVNSGSGLYLSRSTPILKGERNLVVVCDSAEKGSKIKEISRKPMSIQIQVLSGSCKGMRGWISTESIEVRHSSY